MSIHDQHASFFGAPLQFLFDVIIIDAPLYLSGDQMDDPHT
jgi:hypothetical protein